MKKSTKRLLLIVGIIIVIYYFFFRGSTPNIGGVSSGIQANASLGRPA